MKYIYIWLWVLGCTTLSLSRCLYFSVFVSCVYLFVAVCESGNCTSVFCRRYCRQVGHQTGIEVKAGDRGFQERQTFKYG